MVHALEIIKLLLKPDGVVIDIHPTGEPPPIEVVVRDQRYLVGYLQESDGFVEYAQADAALAQVVETGLFSVERKGTFTFVTLAPSVAELRSYLSETWGDAIVAPEIDAHAEEALRTMQAAEQAGPTPIVMSERVRIARLRAG